MVPLLYVFLGIGLDHSIKIHINIITILTWVLLLKHNNYQKFPFIMLLFYKFMTLCFIKSCFTYNINLWRISIINNLLFLMNLKLMRFLFS